MLCRIVPGVVARHPEILNFPKPAYLIDDVEKYHRKFKGKVAGLLEHKLEILAFEKVRERDRRLSAMDIKESDVT